MCHCNYQEIYSRYFYSFAETDPVNFGNAGSHILTIYSVTA